MSGNRKGSPIEPGSLGDPAEGRRKPLSHSAIVTVENVRLITAWTHKLTAEGGLQ